MQPPHSSVRRAWRCSSIPPAVSWKKICFSSSGYILIWLYPENPSMKDIRSNPHVLWIMTSVIGRGNSSLGQASFRYRKSMQIRIFPFFLATGTILPTQLGCCSSLMKPESIIFLTSDWIAYIISGRNRRCSCLTGFTSKLMLRWCIATWGSRPGISL